MFYLFFRGEPTNFRGEATNFRGEATNFHGEATNLFRYHLKLQFEWCHWARKYRFPCKKTTFSCEENAVFAVVNKYWKQERPRQPIWAARPLLVTCVLLV